MGKRSNFNRIDKDFYRTIDPRAVKALIPHLTSRFFVEPCCGDMDLVNSLESEGFQCIIATDISIGFDALDIHKQFYPIITNPPWSRPILHSMIERFVEFSPYCWLLFDSDWMHTKQSRQYMEWCTDIVSVGRLIWIPGTNVSGKDNCSWYRFSADANGTRFWGR